MSDESMSRVIVINGLPKNVTPEKRDAFLRHATKKFSEVLGHSSFQLNLLTDPDTGLVSGAFLVCTTEAMADAALAKLNMYNFTRSDVINTYRWSSFENARQPDEEYVEPQMAPGEADAEDDFAHNMAEDEQARPQFIVKGGMSKDCEWYWFDWEKNEPVMYRRPNVRKDDPVGKWSELDRQTKNLCPGLKSSLMNRARPLPVWSTYGTFMVSQHAPGLRVWGGRSMHLHFEVPEDVEAFLISPSEKYLVVKTANDLSIWNLRTARKIRTLGSLDIHADDQWPITRFSADDSLVAVCRTGYSPYNPTDIGVGKLCIYNSSRMRVVHSAAVGPVNYTFAISGLYKAEWNPKVGTQMAHVSVVGANQGWKVVISNVHFDEEENSASEEVLVQRNFVQAESLDMLWSPSGTHLSVKVTLKKSIEYFLFHVTPRSVAAIQLQIKPGYSASRFSWNTSGEYFALILEKIGQSGGLVETGLLQVHSIKNKLKLLRETTSSAQNIFWAPIGNRLVAVNASKSLLYFYSVNESGVVVEQNKLTNVGALEFQWDPTGRFFASWVSSLSDSSMAPHYRIFDFNGNELFRKEMKPFSHLAWRPLPPSLLNDEEIQLAKDSLKNVLREYEQNIADLKAQEQAKVDRERREVEEKYCKKMNDLARKMKDQELQEIRDSLQKESIWSRYWTSRIKNLKEEDRIVHEERVEEREISRRALD